MNGNCVHITTRAQTFWHTSTGFALVFILSVTCTRIAGNGASEKNLKDGVCAQFEKNFAKAKWRV